MATGNTLRKPGLLVYFCGLGTTLLTLWMVMYMNDGGENIMGWYGNGIIPVGALIVGVLSGLGYALGSRFLQVKLSRGFVMGMIATGVLDYVALQYQNYTHALEKYHISESRLSFAEYFQKEAENMVFKSSRSSSQDEGNALGKGGYFYKLLELIGFTGGSVVPSMMVFGMPYCRRCQVYLKKNRVGFINSTQPWSAVRKLKRAEREAALRQCNGEVQQRANSFFQHVAQVPLQDTLAAMDHLELLNKGATARVTVTLKKCPKCDSHHLDMMLNTYAVNKKAAHAALGKMDKTASEHDLPVA